MGPLPQPEGLASLVLRIDFTDDAAWEALCWAIDADEPRCVTYANDPACTGVTIDDLVRADAAASDDEKLTYLFVADSLSMAGENLLLAVDLDVEPGRTFRAPPSKFAVVSTNLTIADVGFEEFADEVDESGVFRG